MALWVNLASMFHTFASADPAQLGIHMIDKGKEHPQLSQESIVVLSLSLATLIIYIYIYMYDIYIYIYDDMDNQPIASISLYYG